jgi:hypothetical protein
MRIDNACYLAYTNFNGGRYMFSFQVQVYENGVAIIPEDLRSRPKGLVLCKAKVFDKDHLEDALTEMCRYCVDDWGNKDRVKIVRK